MDLKQLQRFASLVDEKSFARASEVLAVSQPSVSRSIQLLEDSLGVTLFDRTAQGVTLTPFGRALLPYARSILNDRAKAIAAISATRQALGSTVRLAVTRRHSGAIIPRAVSILTRQRPDLTLHVAEGEFPPLLDLLRESEVDFAFGPRDSYLDLQGLVFEPLTTSVSAFVVRREHPLARETEWTFEKLCEARWIVAEEPAIQLAWRRMFEVRRLPVPNVALRGASVRVINECLLAADLVAVVDVEDVAEHIASGAIVAVNPDKIPFVQKIGLFWRADAEASAEQRLVADVLRSLCAAPADRECK